MPFESRIGALTAHDPVGCHLQLIDDVEGSFSFTSGAEEFDRLLKNEHGKGTYDGAYFTGTLVSIEQGDKKTVEELKKRKFILLGTQRGAHGDYKMDLYGKGFTLPRRKK